MDRHKCRLCLKSFSNGRALGGHMRSHLLNLPIPPKHEEYPSIQLGEETESASSSSSEEEIQVEVDVGEGGDEEEKGLCYGLRENPKRSIRMVDPEFSFAKDAGSVVLQDRESETDSSKNLTRRRSKRTRKLLIEHEYHPQRQRKEQENNNIVKKLKFIMDDSWAEPEPVSSTSDTSTEQEVAFCLMMLSRDKWKRKEQQEQYPQDVQDEEAESEKSVQETDESAEFNKSCKTSRSRGKYKCETCNKVFKSYQALGGHRASHKKLKVYTPTKGPEFEPENAGTASSLAEKKIHKCPYCLRVFSSGQALGGHKRSHLIGVAAATPARSSTTSGDNLNPIDLNLPPPIDDDDISQIEFSAVSDAEFVNHIKW